MAVKKKTRSKAKGKKSKVGRNLLIAGAVLGAGYASWKFLIKPMLDKKKAEEEAKKKQEEMAKGGESAVSSAVQAIQAIQPNILPAVDQKKNRLSPIGTPFAKINYDAPVFFGDKGAEIVYIQKIANKLNEMNDQITGNRKMNRIAEDGIYGKNTYAMFQRYFPADLNKSGITYSKAYKYLKQQESVFLANVIGTKYSGTIASTIFKSQYE